MGSEIFLYLWIIGIVCLMIFMIIHGLKVSKAVDQKIARVIQMDDTLRQMGYFWPK